jgi:hypothetical protein
VVVGELHRSRPWPSASARSRPRRRSERLESGKQQPRTAPSARRIRRARKHLALVAGGEGDPHRRRRRTRTTTPAATTTSPTWATRAASWRATAPTSATSRSGARGSPGRAGAGARTSPARSTAGRSRSPRTSSRGRAEARLESASSGSAGRFKSESDARLRAMVAVASTEPEMPVEPHELDADPWKLVVANGTIDLNTGELRTAPARGPGHEDGGGRLRPRRPPRDVGPLPGRGHQPRRRARGLPAALGRLQPHGRHLEEVLFFVHGPGGRRQVHVHGRHPDDARRLRGDRRLQDLPRAEGRRRLGATPRPTSRAWPAPGS